MPIQIIGPPRFRPPGPPKRPYMPITAGHPFSQHRCSSELTSGSMYPQPPCRTALNLLSLYTRLILLDTYLTCRDTRRYRRSRVDSSCTYLHRNHCDPLQAWQLDHRILCRNAKKTREDTRRHEKVQKKTENSCSRREKLMTTCWHKTYKYEHRTQKWKMRCREYAMINTSQYRHSHYFTVKKSLSMVLEKRLITRRTCSTPNHAFSDIEGKLMAPMTVFLHLVEKVTPEIKTSHDLTRKVERKWQGKCVMVDRGSLRRTDDFLGKSEDPSGPCSFRAGKSE